MLAAGLGLFTAASAACALSPGAGALVTARAVQGAGAALVLPLSLALLSAAFPPERRAWALGIFSSVIRLAVLGRDPGRDQQCRPRRHPAAGASQPTPPARGGGTNRP
jgi:hypothetical protein